MDTKEIMKRYDNIEKSSELNSWFAFDKTADDLSTMIDKSSRARMQIEIGRKERERQRQSLIRENTCPICSGKLTRGKRDKNNDYKRGWVCNTCSAVHHI